MACGVGTPSLGTQSQSPASLTAVVYGDVLNVSALSAGCSTSPGKSGQDVAIEPPAGGSSAFSLEGHLFGVTAFPVTVSKFVPYPLEGGPGTGRLDLTVQAPGSHTFKGQDVTASGGHISAARIDSSHLQVTVSVQLIDAVSSPAGSLSGTFICALSQSNPAGTVAPVP
jgi:hypothetical protein